MPETTTDTTAATTATTAGTATTATTTTAPLPFAGPDGKFAEGWAERIDPSLAPLGKKFQTVEGMAKSYVALERQMSGKKVPLPDENSTPEEWAQFWQRAGAPEQPDGYAFEKPKDVADAVWRKEDVEAWRSFAHGIHMPKKMAEQVAAWQAGRVNTAYSQAMEQSQAQLEEAQTLLKTDWGTKYDYNLAVAARAAIAIGGEEMLQHPMAKDPAFVRAMFKVGSMISDDKLTALRQQQGLVDGDPTEEIEKIEAQMAENMKNPRYDKNSPAHKSLLAKRDALYKQKFPGPAAGNFVLGTR
jgi:hypothetical protein